MTGGPSKTRVAGGSPSSRLLCSTSAGSSRSDRYKTFKEARALARSLGFKSMKDWAEWSRTKERPRDIPADPRVVYGGDEGLWQGWEDFLGCDEAPGSGSPESRWLPFEEARDYVWTLDLKPRKEWEEWSKSGEKPPDIPSDPYQTYKDEGWKSWGDFLGYKAGCVVKGYMAFEDARDYVRTLGLSSQKEWWEWRNVNEEKPPDIPSAPYQIYKDEGWKSWGDFLGFKAGYEVKGHMAFEDARDYVRTLGLTSVKEWREWSNESGKKPPHIPSAPDVIYKDEGWLSWGNFLGFKEGYVVKGYMAFEEARDYVRSLGFKSKEEWEEWRKSGERPFGIPSNPEKPTRLKGG